MTAFARGTEWSFGGIDFDGFAAADCNLKEAKSRYDQFLVQAEDMSLKPKEWYRAFDNQMIPQARRQADVARAFPPSRLTWYFQGPLAFEYMSTRLSRFPPLMALRVP